jgi:uncharacterized protein (TIGR03437 family)
VRPNFLIGMFAGLVFSVIATSPSVAQSTQNLTVTSAANFQIGLPPKGSIATAFCVGFQVHGVIYGITDPLPFVLDGISIMVGGAPAPILGVADDGGYQQINFEVPQEATPNPDGTWTVTANQSGNKLTATLASLPSPGDFFLVGGDLAALQHSADYSLVTEQNPAHPGEVLVGCWGRIPQSRPATPRHFRRSPLYLSRTLLSTSLSLLY